MRRTVALLVLAAGCSGAGGDERATSASPTSSPPTTSVPRVEIDALFDVGGHKLHLYCKGSGSPTVVYMYAVTYPKEVAGMVLLDASFPEELDLERYFPEDERWDHTEWKELEEQVDQLTSYQQAHALLGNEPDIPMTYLLAMPSGWTGPPAYEAVVLDRIARYVDRFSPGVLVEVESPHYMEAAVPERIVQELEKVIAKA